MSEITLVEDSGLVFLKISSLLEVADAKRIRKELTAAAAAARVRFGAFRLVADASAGPVQPMTVLAELPTPATLMINTLDRWAVVVGSSLAKMQATRMLSHPQT